MALSAYNHTRHLPQRKEMMQRWVDYLDGPRKDQLRQQAL